MNFANRAAEDLTAAHRDLLFTFSYSQEKSPHKQLPAIRVKIDLFLCKVRSKTQLFFK